MQAGLLTKALSKPAQNPPTPVEDNPLRYTFRTPPTTAPSFNSSNAERLTYTPSSEASAEAATDSTVTKITKEWQAAREDFRSSLAQLSQVHSRLARENSEHVMRADVITREMDEMRKGLLEIQAEGRQNQERLEASMAFLNDLIKQRETMTESRMAEMTAVMRERDRQADERTALLSHMMQRRDTDANIRMVDLMTTMKDLTLGVRAIVSQTAAAHTQWHPRYSTTPVCFPPVQLPRPRKLPTGKSRSQRRASQTREPATYKGARNIQAKTSKKVRVAHADSSDAGTDPMTDVSSFDPFARGASTTGDY